MNITGYNRGFWRSVVTAQQMRELDRQAIEQYGVDGLVLMENAGRAVADEVVRRVGDGRLRRVVIAAGSGNNGGDGFVAARHLQSLAVELTVFLWADKPKVGGDALANLEMAERAGVKIDYSRDLKRFQKAVSGSNVIIDALLGTGAKGALKPEYAEVVRIINLSGSKVIAVDIPSGIDADTGVELGPSDDLQNIGCAAVKATSTVTFALPKVGLLTYPGAWYAGDIVVADIGMPLPVLASVKPAATLLGRSVSSAAGLGMPRLTDSHKGAYGHVAIVAGSVGMTGAATLSAVGALRIGTGLVTALVPESLNDIMEIKLTEAMTIPVPECKARAFGIDSLDVVLSCVNKWDAAVIGPGFGRDPDTIEFTKQLIRQLQKPAIIDADALYAVAQDLNVLKQCKAPLVITPHPGEMATLLGTTSEQVQSNRLDAARAFAKEYGVTVVLKGAGSVIAAQNGQVYINPTGTPAMATGGTGDVLSGMIGGLLAQKCEPVTAANAAVYYHGLAGEIAARKRSEPAMLATDLAESIGDAIMQLRITGAEQAE